MKLKTIIVSVVAFVVCYVVSYLLATRADGAPTLGLIVEDQKTGNFLFNEEASGSDKQAGVAWAKRLEELLPRDSTVVRSIRMRSTDPSRFDVRVVVDTNTEAPEWIRQLRLQELPADPMALVALVADHLAVDIVITEGSRPIWVGALEEAMALTTPPAGVENRDLEAVDFDVALSEDGQKLEGQLTFFTSAIKTTEL
jgi:hypothetical protein